MSSVDSLPRWPTPVRPEHLSANNYDVATAVIRERLRITVRVCDALRDADEVDSDGPRRAYFDAVEWLVERYEMLPSDEIASGMDMLVVPDDHVDHLWLLEAANRVCRALSMVWSASISEYPRDIADVRYELDRFYQREHKLAREPSLFSGSAGDWLEDFLRRNLEEVPDEHEDDDDEDDERGDVLDRLLRAPRPQGEPDEPEEPDESWELLRSIAEKVFGTSGSVQAWARDAWQALGRAGLTDFEGSEIERARVACRLLCLDVLRQEFAVRAFDDGAPGYWSVDAGVLTADELDGIHPVTLGVLAEREGVGDDVDGSDNSTCQSDAVTSLVWQLCPAVARALQAQQRDAILFASLWASDRDGVVYPLSDEAVREIVNYDLTGDKMVAYQWIDEGMPIWV